MNWRFLLDSGALEWALAVLALLGLLLLWPILRRLPPALRLSRAAVLLLLALCLLKPALDHMDARSFKPRLAVLIDTGPSMQAGDDRGSPRLSRAARWLKARRRAIEASAEPVLYAGSTGARRIAWEELDALQTTPASLDPAAAAAEILDDGPPPSRVWLLSDGAFESDESLDRALEGLKVPVDALGVGPLKVKPALAVTAVTAPDFVFLHGRFPLSVTLEAVELPGADVRLRLLRTGERSSVLSEARLSPAGNFEVLQASFTVEAQSLGSQSYRLEAEASTRGARLAAAREFRVEAIRQKQRIMYLAGRPSFEYSHLRAHLKGDPNHELVSFVILRNPENVSPVPDQELSPLSRLRDIRRPLPARPLHPPEFRLSALQSPAALQNLRRSG